jgi:hypothetical protein
LPSELSFNAETGVISGVPAFGSRGEYTVTVRATDPGGLFVDASFTLVILPAQALPDGAIFRDGFEALNN